MLAAVDVLTKVLSEGTVTGEVGADLLQLVAGFQGHIGVNGTDWVTSTSSQACAWTGVTCTSAGELQGLTLGNRMLKGKLSIGDVDTSVFVGHHVHTKQLRLTLFCHVRNRQCSRAAATHLLAAASLGPFKEQGMCQGHQIFRACRDSTSSYSLVTMLHCAS